MKTAKKWLGYGEELALELAKVLTPGPWKHDMDSRRAGVCHKCKRLPDGYCPVPDPIDIKDWNVAKYWQKRCDERKFLTAAREVFKVLYPDATAIMKQVYWWLARLCKREDAAKVIIATAMATEKRGEG